tara:strand:+ start:156 stop:824 length:669 start_codon:yes stop_codon:yes gene_type:complete
MKIIAIVQARITSKRLPNKVLINYNHKTVIEHIYYRLKKSRYLSDIVFAIPSNKKNLILKNFLKTKNIKFFIGPENNVLKRFYKVSLEFNPNIIIRITADCPLIDYKLMDKMIFKFLKYKKFDFLSNTITRTFPVGLDVEIFSKNILFKTFKEATSKYDKEHVTPYMKRNFEYIEYKNKQDYSHKRWTLDTLADHKKINKIFNFFKNKKKIYLWKEIIKLGF